MSGGRVETNHDSLRSSSESGSKDAHNDDGSSTATATSSHSAASSDGLCHNYPLSMYMGSRIDFQVSDILWCELVFCLLWVTALHCRYLRKNTTCEIQHYKYTTANPHCNTCISNCTTCLCHNYVTSIATNQDKSKIFKNGFDGVIMCLEVQEIKSMLSTWVCFAL